MKKVTIITFPEYESLVLDSLGAAGVTQLKEVTGPDYDEYQQKTMGPDYKALFKNLEPLYQELKKLISFKIERQTPSLEVLREYTRNPDIKTKEVVTNLEKINSMLKGVKEAQSNESERINRECEENIQKGSALYHEKRRNLQDHYAKMLRKLQLVKALGQEGLSDYLIHGVINNDYIKRLEQHIAKYPVTIKATDISGSESLVRVSGPEDARKWIHDLFLVFESDALSVILGDDTQTIADPVKRNILLDKYQEALDEWVKAIDVEGQTFEEKLASLEKAHQEKVNLLEQEKIEKLKASEFQWIGRYQKVEASVKDDEMKALSEADFAYNLLRLASDSRAPVLRTKIFSIIQGWTPLDNIADFNAAIEEVEKRVGEDIIVDIVDIEHGEKGVPTPPPKMRPAILEPTWKLTTLRGWPTNFEINPAYISVIVFCFQFGLMYGDMGQGAIFLILGFILSRKYEGKGMLGKIGGLFIPMGIAAMIFGVLYDSFFLIEGLLFHHQEIFQIRLPAPIYALITVPLPNPIHQTNSLMILIFMIAAIEVIIGLVLGAINQIKKGNPIGALGEHGLGMILYVGGLFLTAMYFIRIGMNFMQALSYWAFYVMLIGIGLSFLEPILHSLRHGHGIGMESIGEGVGGLLMTFVEGLANLFSFLRIAAFALAHTSLAIAAEALNHALVLPIPIPTGLVIMNVVALSFEFVSSSVQSLRLLYYEFMGKFFDGQGVPFRPFSIPKERRVS